ncbi:hypothetical protein [Aquitalea magnusonii]|uniref:hypothetical protein n=1 Tax=Aquitalea magnusonii TaxID=332411 RepID=UPI0007500DA0|nr:hypothetical protein [Aquitalea magnusonii]
MKRNRISSLLLGLCMASSLMAETPLWQQADYVAAILKARAGEPAAALAMLEKQRARRHCRAACSTIT